MLKILSMKINDYNHQIFEPSLFTRQPFLRIGDHVFIPYKFVLKNYKTVGISSIYDWLT